MKSMRIKHTTLFILTIFTLLSCEDKQPEGLIIANYPMSIGTSWTYEKKMIYNIYKSVTSDSIEYSDTLKFNGTKWIEKDTIINKNKVLVFRTIELFHTQNISYNHYYFMNKSGFYLFGLITFDENPQTSKIQKVLQSKNIENFYRTSKANTGIYIYNKPVLDIKYPLTLNSEWISDFSADNGIPVTKRVIGTDTLRINDSDHVCFKVLSEYPAGILVSSIIQWISKDGLLKSESNFGISYSTDANGNRYQKSEIVELMTVTLVSKK